MVHFTLSSVAALASFMALATTTSSVLAAPVPESAIGQAAPALDKRIVGTLHCKPYKTGTLSLYNAQTKERRYVSVKKDDTVNGSGPLLISTKQVTPKQARFTFSTCEEDDIPNKFEDYLPAYKGIYYGHLSPVDGAHPKAGAATNPAKCVQYQPFQSSLNYLATGDCYYSDDSGSVKQYFSFTPDKQGQVDFLGSTGPQGGKPATDDEKHSEYDFLPSNDADQPALTVHHGSPNFSQWKLQLL